MMTNRLSTIEKYAQPEVVEFWRCFSAQGLQKCEAEMLARYAPPPARVLDLGCGAGRAGLALAGSSYQVTGLDLVWELIHTARGLHVQHQLPVRLVQADLLSIPCGSAQYDVALIFIAAIQHLAGRSTRRRALGEIGRALHSDGVLILALDNLAPALTCYAWWTWRKARSVRQRSASAARPGTSADQLLASRHTRMSRPLWHLRGLLRTLRWRTWTGVIDAGRRAQLLRGEIGDTAIDQVSLTPTPGSVYYHLYQHRELIEDAAAANFELMGYHSGRELNENQLFTPRVRQLDKQVLYAFRRV